MNAITKFLIKQLLLAACILFLMQCNSWDSVITVPRESGIKLYHDKLHLVGQNYRSLGRVSAVKSGIGSNMMFLLNNDYLSADEDGYFTADEDAGPVIRDLVSEIMQKARGLGANSVVNVKYRVVEFPFCGPFMGPFSHITYTVYGEAVVE